MRDVLGLGNLLLSTALIFAVLIVVFEWVERRREGAREKRLLEEIDREYQLLLRAGRL